MSRRELKLAFAVAEQEMEKAFLDYCRVRLGRAVTAADEPFFAQMFRGYTLASPEDPRYARMWAALLARQAGSP